MKNKLIPKHQTPSQPLVLLNDNTLVIQPVLPIPTTNIDWITVANNKIDKSIQEQPHSEVVRHPKRPKTEEEAMTIMFDPRKAPQTSTTQVIGMSPVDPVGEFVVGNAVLSKPLQWLGKGLLYGFGRYTPKTKLGNWSRAKIISNNMKTIQPQLGLTYYITGNSSSATSPKMRTTVPVKTPTKGAMVLQQRSPAKISASERAGIPKGNRNQSIAPKYNGKRDVHNSLYKGAAKDNRDLPYTLKDIDGADSYVAENMRYSNKQAKQDFTNKYEQISERYLGNPDNLDKFNGILSDYIKTLPNPDEMFLNSNGWQSAYVLDYRKYLYNLGYDAADISDYDLAKLISLLYRDLTTTMTGKTKGMVMWHGSPKMFDRFDLANTGNYTGNMGYGGPGNYFSNARTRYGRTEGNGVLNLQPYLITNVQSTPHMTIMRDKGLIPYYLSPEGYRPEEYKLIILDLIKKTSIDDNKLYIDDISALPVSSLDPINGIRSEYMLRRNDGIKSLFPHPSLFVRDNDGIVHVNRNWLDPRVNYKQGGKLIIHNKMTKKLIKKPLVKQPSVKRLDVKGLLNDPEYKQKYNWYINPKNISLLQDSLIARGAGFPQRIAVLSQVIPESGGNTKPHGNGAYGYVGWRGDRAKGLPNTPDGQAHVLMVDLFEDPSDWNHGGTGTNVNSGKEMQLLFVTTPNTVQATRAFMKGYVRPPLIDRDKRILFVELLKRYMK